ncbi:hypothetical protein GF342_02325 [Candidatus Woesearchaeota archaeon]|nr:hypothetical protein [Candidatus Woesearchaeota archaeon]
MTLKITLGKGAKKTFVLHQHIKKKEAEALAQKQTSLAFVEGIKSVFGRKGEPPKPANYHLRYHPFWHVQGESFFEYKRTDTYQFSVGPEVREVNFGKQHIKTIPGENACAFEGIAHCFEHYEKELLQDALTEKGKNFTSYLDKKKKELSSLRAIKDGKVGHIHVRASFLLNQLYAEVIKPINADKVLESKVVINALALHLVPIHIFEFSLQEKTKVILVDAVTGDARKDSGLFASLMHKYWSGETVFDIGSELASTIIPGAGIGMILAKKAMDKRKTKHTTEKRQKFNNAYKKK